MTRRLGWVSGVVLLGLWTAPLAAQRPGFGIQGGINFAKFGGSDVGDVDTRTGFQAGVVASFPLGRYFAVEPSASYSLEGTKVDAGAGITGTFKLDYIEVPVLLKASAPLQGSAGIRPYVVIGPGIGFQVSCKIKASSGSQSAEADCSDNSVNADTKAVQFSLHFGAGVEVGRFAVGARYQLGLSSIDDTGGDADIKNRVLAIVASYRLFGAR